MEANTYYSKIHLINRWKTDGWVTHIKISQGHLIAGTSEGSIYYYDLQAPYELRAHYKFDDEITSIITHQNGYLVSIASGQIIFIDCNGEISKGNRDYKCWKIKSVNKGYCLFDRNGLLVKTDSELNEVWRGRYEEIWSLVDIGVCLLSVSMKGNAQLIDSVTGEVIWNTKFSFPVYACDFVDDKLFVGTAEGTISVLNMNGEIVKEIHTPAIRILEWSHCGLLAGMVDGSLTCFDKELNIKWKFKTGSWIKSVIYSNGVIWLGSADHCVYGLDSNGNCLAKFETGYTVLSVNEENGIIGVGSADGYAYALRL